MERDQVTYTLTASEWDAHWRDANRTLITTTVAVICLTVVIAFGMGILLGFVAGVSIGGLP